MKKSLIIKHCMLLAFFSHATFASTYIMTNSSQGTSHLFEKISSPIEGNASSFQLDKNINPRGDIEYKFTESKQLDSTYNWVIADGILSSTPNEVYTSCDNLTYLGFEWKAPTTQEIKDGLSNNFLVSILEALSGDDLVKGFSKDGEWYYIRSRHEGGAINKVISEKTPYPTICMLK
ncbi:hypothetical protein [Aliivibrio fischeri]|uniref:hypothetical protein n=1 Tax=Aliivibrio fischeri TaxID=668 RepID=UPI00084CE1E4|nr:hypothetical protein [Aliivibrio fischeri]OED57234.1 hypothetical protein BEI47_11545 [Aliivibrio fischeri]